MGVKRDVVIISCIFGLSNAASGILTPIWPIYILQLGATMTELGLVFSASNIAATFLQIPSGVLSDRFGRKRLHALGVLLGILPPIMYSSARNWVSLVPWALLSGLSSGLTSSIRWTVVADTSAKDMARAYSWSIASMLMGMTLGPFFGGFVSDLYGIKAAFYISFSLYLVTFVLALLLHETRSEPLVETNTISQGDNSLLRVALVFSATNIIQGLAFNMISPISPVFYTTKFSIDYTQLGIVYALGTGLPSVLIQFPGGRIANRYNRKKLIMLTIVLSSPFFATIPLSRNLAELMLSLFMNSTIMNLAWPAYQALMMDLAPPAKRGLVNGVSMTTMWIGMTAGSALSGLLWEGLGASSPYFVAALLFPLSAIPFLLLNC